MKRKELLNKRMQRLEAKKQSLVARAQASQDANEVRSINEQIEEVNADLAEVKEELEAIEEEERAAAAAAEEAEKRGTEIPAGAKLVNPQVRGSFSFDKKEEEDPTNTIEYRKAFMAYCQRGTEIPKELAVVRSGDANNTASAGAAIPMTVMNEVINTVRKVYGNIYSKVRKMNVQGGVKIPVGALQATFKWVTEKTTAPREKAGTLGDVVFAYNLAELRIATTFLASITTLSAFEAELTQVIAKAYLQAMDLAVVKGSGDGAPLGILNDARVTKTVTMTAAEFSNWTKWREKFFAALPLGYRAGDFIFALSTIESKLLTMADSNNNPIFRQATGLEISDGDDAMPYGRFYGREVEPVESDVLPDFDTASQGDVVGIYWQPDQYAVNENFGFAMRRYFDEETNEWVDKALVVVDGKVLNPTGFYNIIKG